MSTKILDYACQVWGFMNAGVTKPRKVNDAEVQSAIEKTELRVAQGEKCAIETVGGFMVTSRLSGDIIMTCICDIRVYRGVKVEKAGKFGEGLV